MRRAAIALLALAVPMTGGCIVKTAADIVTAPVRAGAQVVDWTTTSQEESDRNYGREMRKREAREGKERRAWEKACRQRPDECRPYDGYVASRPD
ncbi:hypothetical protein ACPVPU_15275 [Sphingomonas sp. CJ99]